MQTARLDSTINAITASAKGILAIDESNATIKKRFSSISVESTEENRRAYRELLITAEDIHQYISGMILYDETIRQATKNGKTFSQILAEQNILAGIKVDRGLKPFAGHSTEKITEGLDGLSERLDEYKKLGACFAKWRAVITIGDKLPSNACIQANAHVLARYASICQQSDIVPIIEPEVLMEGTHQIETCYDITEHTLKQVFMALYEQNVGYEHTILKVNMIVSGQQCQEQADVKKVSDLTVRCLLNNVPASVPMIVFLSGGQGSEQATAHLNQMNRDYPKLPWKLSFSYGRALQQPCLQYWGGKTEHIAKAQNALKHRAKCNSLACVGQYSQSLEEVV